MRGEPRAHEVLDVGRKRLGRRRSAFQHNEGLHDLGAQRIRLADHRCKRDRRMADETILDLAGPDAIAGRSDDIIIAADEGEIALLVDDALVAGRHPVADEFLARRITATPITKKHHRIWPFHGDLAELARRAKRAVAADHRDRVAGHRLADRAGAAHAERSAAREHEIAFGLAIELVDDEAKRRLAPFERLGPERFTAGAHRAQPDSVAAAWIFFRAERAEA